MALSITVRLRDGRYDAAGRRADVAEWPPHPARVFCALVASATGEEHWEALRWLEAAEAPEVWACEEFTQVRREGFVVANATDKKGSSQHRWGRSGRKKTRLSAEPAFPEFALVWPHASPSPEVLGTLVRLARSVPYLGRSTSPVTLSVVDEVVPERAEWTRFTPVRLGDPTGQELLRVPYGGYTDQLRKLYAQGERSWNADQEIPYARPGVPPPVPPATSVFNELLVFGFASGSVKPPGDAVVAVTSVLRAAVMDRIGTDIPPEISGHGADESAHVAYLTLPNVDNDHADGRLLGVGVAVPETLPRNAYARLWGALVERPLEYLSYGNGGRLPVEFQPSTPGWGLRPERWTADQRRGARTWVTATPMMLDRFPKRRRGDDGILKEIQRSLEVAGYPPVRELEFSPASLARGAVHRPRRGSVPSNRPLRPLVHAKVTFERPVVGPVLLGSMRYLGLGLFAPQGGGRE
ncbi:type I-U CRISPR-associated protein Csb2 [Spirillospora sp. NPDC049652]